MRLASMPGPDKALVWDYQTISTGLTNFVFAGSTNYYIVGTVPLNGQQTVFEDGVVLKMATNACLWVQSGVADFRGTPFHPVLISAKDDNTISETISGSSGNPNTNWYGNPALRFSAGTPVTIQNLRIRYAAVGIEYTGPSNVLSHSQLFKVQTGFQPYSTNTAQLALRNVLAAGITNLFAGSNLTVSAEHLTLANSQCLIATNATVTASLTNCLLVAVTNTAGYSGLSNQETNSIGGVFQTNGAGQFYLPTNSQYLAAGTTNIDPTLLAELAQRTTYAPTILSNVIVVHN